VHEAAQLSSLIGDIYDAALDSLGAHGLWVARRRCDAVVAESRGDGDAALPISWMRARSRISGRH